MRKAPRAEAKFPALASPMPDPAAQDKQDLRCFPVDFAIAKDEDGVTIFSFASSSP